MNQRVPILTQSEDWALLLIHSPINLTMGSNPHPVRRLGAIGTNTIAIAITGVPILTQSEDWALCATLRLISVDSRVPILTQSEDWALLRLQKPLTG